MKNILFLNDYSENSAANYQYALRLGEHFGAKIHLAHIYQIPRSTMMYDYVDTVQVYYGNYKNNEEQWSEKEKQKSAVFIQAHTPAASLKLVGNQYLKEGYSAYDLLDIAEKDEMDLIVMGMNQQGKVANALFGNLSLKVIEDTRCPVLLIPPQCSHHALKEIVFAADFNLSDTDTIQYFLNWGKAFNANLEVLHVVGDHDKLQEDMEQMNEWKQHFFKEISNNQLAFFLQEGKPEETIEKFLQIVKADLICLSTHTRNFWEHLLTSSFTKDLARHIQIPVLVLKAEYEPKE